MKPNGNPRRRRPGGRKWHRTVPRVDYRWLFRRHRFGQPDFPGHCVLSSDRYFRPNYVVAAKDAEARFRNNERSNQ